MTEDKITVLQWLEHHFSTFFIKIPTKNTKKMCSPKKQTNKKKEEKPTKKSPKKAPTKQTK